MSSSIRDIIRKKHAPVLQRQAAPEPAPAPVEQSTRSIGQTEGERLDMTPTLATTAEQAWNQALNAFESELCLVRDPKDPERAWLALRINEQDPLLLKSFPLYEHPRQERSDNEPY